ncbi:MAG: glutathione S-transferase [Candidatus Binatia bacterium]
MLLYHAASSYYSMIARLALREAGVAYDERRLDIHRAKEQLAPWYVAINPHMTVPTLVEGPAVWRDSRDILAVAAARAGAAWEPPSAASEAVVAAHYAIPIERLTFARMMTRLPPLRFLFPRLLRRIVRDLEAELPTAADPSAVRAKIAVNRERIAYFGGGDLRDKLEAERAHVRRFLAALPAPVDLLFGPRPSSADIVTAVLLSRLRMIGEWALTAARGDIAAYLDRMAARPAFAAADVWTRFQLRRLLAGK